MKLSFLLTALAALVCGCRPAAKPSDPPTWQYNEFEFHAPDFKTLQGESLWCYYCEIEMLPEGGRQVINSNLTSSVGEVLNLAGAHGWELVWSDGENYIVKRPADVWTNGDFSVLETEIPKQ
ncbi:MAG: hypothetical protein KGL39_13250 [Patescibacteria group bacterium]|nr:hypothetical protein [Patescibacteria group bacterium]